MSVILLVLYYLCVIGVCGVVYVHTVSMYIRTQTSSVGCYANILYIYVRTYAENQLVWKFCIAYRLYIYEP